MKILNKFRELILGRPRNPLSPETQRHIALVAILAWVGLGADGLSSSCYGPEESFIALGPYTSLALYIAIATALTVFVISVAYNQVIELFPSGGGGYKVATQLLGKHAGLLSGCALIVDYVLTIAISAASGMDALFSLLPLSAQEYKFSAEIVLILLLIGLNLRGMKESIKVLMPIFLGFVAVHIFLILYGVITHRSTLPEVFIHTANETHSLAKNAGWAFVIALLLRSYSLGSGTYTGLEAVSNNVNRLAHPRVSTGKWTMFYMAVSLSFTAGGIILLYLLWQVQPVDGETLNAVVFHKILGNSHLGHTILIITLALEAGLLFVGSNTGFLAGPTVLANMAIDSWLPNRFRHLSSRLVTQNGVILYGLAALIILFLSHGEVSWLVVLYSINVFITFTLSILGLCVYWWSHRSNSSKNWHVRFIFSVFALLLSGGILLVTIFSKFTAGGWVTVVITGAVIALCLVIKNYYDKVSQKLKHIDQLMAPALTTLATTEPALTPDQPTAAILIGKSRGAAMHSLLWIMRMFPNHFKNFIFLSAGIVDVESFSGKKALANMQTDVQHTLDYFVNFCHQRGLAAKGYATFGTDPVQQLTDTSEEICREFTNTIFFATKLVFTNDNWVTRFLHNETAVSLQRRLHMQGIQLVILPMRIE
jgi:amino acid transporter